MQPPRTTHNNGVVHRVRVPIKMKANIKLSLSKLKPSDLLTFFRNVIAKLTGNPHYPALPVALADMETTAQELEDLIEAAIQGSKQSRLLRDAKIGESTVILRSTADYVRMVAQGDAAILESSGFPLAAARLPIGIPGAPLNVEARMTTLRGEVEVRWKSVRGAHGYQLWITDQDPATATNWQAIAYTTRVKHLVTSLESYKAYFFCVSAIGTAGEGAQSDPAMGRAA